jgi:hypothetical protein
MKDAYRQPRFIVEGCQHRLGCRCETPFWLREMSPVEEARMAHRLGMTSEPIADEQNEAQS